MTDAERALRLRADPRGVRALRLGNWLAMFPEFYSPGGDVHQAVKDTLSQATQ